ncbi:MAG: PIN domain-containing protein [Burkholderiales bacterium]|nr:PIN domain-containing protein [Burkholderiales bacterium]
MSQDPQIAVLDTNVVLDWLLFANPQCAPLQQALTSAALRWVATAEMRDELTHVLRRGHLDRWQADLAQLGSQWDKYCVEVPVPPPANHATRLRCTDVDDQKFIDLALACGARWLLSRDRAVLKLARKAQARGLTIQTPGAWAAAHT